MWSFQEINRFQSNSDTTFSSQTWSDGISLWKNRSKVKANRRNRTFPVPLMRTRSRKNMLKINILIEAIVDIKKYSTSLIYDLRLIRWKRQNCNWWYVANVMWFWMDTFNDFFCFSYWLAGKKMMSGGSKLGHLWTGYSKMNRFIWGREMIIVLRHKQRIHGSKWFFN